MKVVEISLFSGVGMFSYGFQRVNPQHEVGCFVECEAFPQKVLRARFPGVPIYDDVRDVTYERLKEDGAVADARITQPLYLISSGFPCQDLSAAGKQAGIDGERSGLWSECARIISELRHLSPIVFIENVPTLLTGESGAWGRRVLRDLAEIFLHGDIPYRVEGHIVPAGDANGRLSVGAPHRRERAWIVAHPKHDGQHEGPHPGGTEGPGREEQGTVGAEPEYRKPAGQSDAKDVAYPDQSGSQGHRGLRERASERTAGEECGAEQGRGLSFTNMGLLAHGAAARLARHRWLPEPGIGRVAAGIPDRAAKLKALGNGLVWQIPAAIYASLLDLYATKKERIR